MQLHEALAGQELIESDFRVPRFATLNLGGWTVSEVLPRGKHLLIRVVSPATDSPATERNAVRALTIHSHLKMEGSWQVYPPRGRWRKPGHTARCVLRTATADAVGFSLGVLEVVPTAEEDQVVGYLGPDLLGPDWDPAEAERRLRAAPGVPLGVALLDQRNVAGIGNIYRCEVCFLAGTHPATPVAEISGLGTVLENAKRLLQANAGPMRRRTVGVDVIMDGLRGKGRGDSLQTAAAGRPAALGRPAAGRPATSYWVYRREHQPCLRCGTPIRRGVLGPASGLEERDIYFCPSCQPEPQH
jgi:endonuclease-8